MPYGEHLRDAPAAALADERHALPGRIGQAVEPLRQPLHYGAGTVHVRAHAGALRAVSGPAQPLGHQPQRVVAGEEARDQHHGLAAGVLHVETPEYAAAEKGGGLERDPAFAPDWRQFQGRRWHQDSPGFRLPRKESIAPAVPGHAQLNHKSDGNAIDASVTRMPPMRAATIRDGAVVVEEHPDPEPGTGEVLVRVRAAGL